MEPVSRMLTAVPHIRARDFGLSGVGAGVKVPKTQQKEETQDGLIPLIILYLKGGCLT